MLAFKRCKKEWTSARENCSCGGGDGVDVKSNFPDGFPPKLTRHDDNKTPEYRLEYSNIHTGTTHIHYLCLFPQIFAEFVVSIKILDSHKSRVTEKSRN